MSQVENILYKHYSFLISPIRFYKFYQSCQRIEMDHYVIFVSVFIIYAKKKD